MKETKGTTSRILSVFLRAGQLVCGAVVLGILGHFFHNVHKAGVVSSNGRLIYAAVIAGITILASLLCLVPFAHTFWAFPLDLLLFAAWLIAFSLTETASWLSSLPIDQRRELMLMRLV